MRVGEQWGLSVETASLGLGGGGWRLSVGSIIYLEVLIKLIDLVVWNREKGPRFLTNNWQPFEHGWKKSKAHTGDKYGD